MGFRPEPAGGRVKTSGRVGGGGGQRAEGEQVTRRRNEGGEAALPPFLLADGFSRS